MSDDLTLFDPPDNVPGGGELPQTHAAASDDQMVTAPVPPQDVEFESDEPPPDHVLSGPIEPGQPEDVGPPSWDERWTDGSPPHVQAPQRLLADLNEKQTTAAAALNGPVLVVAGPGSGKTRVVTHRLAALLDQQVPATRLLAMTFTNKAAEEMRNRVAELAGLDQDTVRRMWIGTFHSMCARLLRIHHAEAGLPRSFVIVDSDDQLKILRDLLRPAAEQDAAHDATTREVTQAATQLARDARDTISNAKARLLTPDKMADSPRQSEREFATTAAAYRDKLEELGAVDFDDLLVRAVQLLEDHSAVRNMWRRRFWFVHVDEYQDTSDVQHRLVRLLVGDHHNVCVVGDADQCHPPGVKILMSDGENRAVESVQDGERVVSWNQRHRKHLVGMPYLNAPSNKVMTPGRGRLVHSNARQFTGDLVVLEVGDKTLPVTPEHRLLYRFTEQAWNDPKWNLVYLMRQGHKWRVGKSFLARSCGKDGKFNFGPSVRFAQEKADALWVLSVHDDEADAIVAEKTIAARYGIPTMMFELGNGRTVLEQDDVERFFASLPDVKHRAHQLLDDYNLDPRYPLIGDDDPEINTAVGGATYTKLIRACNFISGLMTVPAQVGETDEVEFLPATVHREAYSGPVHSLDVDGYKTYVANGIVVHNSIYGWRSARPELLNQIVEDYDDVTVVTLDRNYRSTKKIVDVAKAIIEPSPAKFRAELWTDNDDGKPVDLLVCEDDRTEAKQVTSRIGVSGEPYEEHAILFRTNAQSRLLEQQLLDRRIPYRVVGTVRFYDRAEVKDAIAWLRAATNPGDQLAFERAAQAPRRGIGDATLEKVAAYADKTGEPIVVAARQVADGAGGLSTRACNAVGRYVQLLTELGNAAARGPVDAVKFAIEECGVADHVRKTHKNDTDKIADKLANLDQLRAAAAETEAGGLPELDEDNTATASRSRRSDGWWQTIAFLEEAALASSADAEENGVALMTVHAAKGREFDHVYVVGVEEDYFPHKLSQDTDAQIHEERRLLFVAVSRARKKLTVSYCTNRWTFGSAEDRTASRFLADLPQHVVVHDMLDETHGGFNRSNTGPAGSTGSSRRKYSNRRRTTSTSMRPGRRNKKRSRSGPKVNPDLLQVGTRVTHPKFGAGAVTKPGRERATIEFDDGTEKVLLLEYAPLKIVS